MKTIFSYFPGMFENPAPAVKTKYEFFKNMYKSFLTIFALKTQQIEVKMVAITIDYYLTYAFTPFHFSRTVPLSLVSLQLEIGFLSVVNFICLYFDAYCKIEGVQNIPFSPLTEP